MGIVVYAGRISRCIEGECDREFNDNEMIKIAELKRVEQRNRTIGEFV